MFKEGAPEPKIPEEDIDAALDQIDNLDNRLYHAERELAEIERQIKGSRAGGTVEQRTHRQRLIQEIALI
jgi:hypothetical protein